MRRGLSLVALLVWAASTAAAQTPQPTAAAADPEAGRPLIQLQANGSRRRRPGLGHSPGPSRRANVGTNPGVLEYDGSTWRLIEVPNSSTVRSLAIDERGRVYVGGVGDFGFLEADATGSSHFVSLQDKLPAGTHVIDDVWRTFAAPEGIYFQTEHLVMRWSQGTMRLWRPADHFNRSSFVNGHLYVPQPGLGLTELVDDEFRTLRGTERFGEEQFPVVLPWDANRLLLGARVDGLFLYDGATAVPFKTEVDAFLNQSTLYRAIPLRDGTILLMSPVGGVAVMDRQGRRVQIINSDAGLQTDVVYNALVDREGAVWLATGRGIARAGGAGVGDVLRGQGRRSRFDSIPRRSLRRDRPRCDQAAAERRRRLLAQLRAPARSFVAGVVVRRAEVARQEGSVRPAAGLERRSLQSRERQGHANRRRIPRLGSASVCNRPGTRVDWTVRRCRVDAVGRQGVGLRRPRQRCRRAGPHALRDCRWHALGRHAGNRFVTPPVRDSRGPRRGATRGNEGRSFQ